ncbi:MAG: hypothetical protein AABX37_00345 [Nanoarchaeota archaeon]
MLIKTTPDAEKAKSILNMVDSTLNMIDGLNVEKFPSQIIKEYYGVLRELSAIIALLDGYKTLGEGAHKELIDYVHTHYPDILEGHHFQLFEELRTIRNKIAYDGFFVNVDYLKRNKESIGIIIQKLKRIIRERLK